MPDKIFPAGFHYHTRRQRAPDFIIGGVSVKLDEFVEWAKQYVNERGYLEIDIKKSKAGKVYAELNTYKPTNKPPAPTNRERFEDDITDADVPF